MSGDKISKRGLVRLGVKTHKGKQLLLLNVARRRGSYVLQLDNNWIAQFDEKCHAQFLFDNFREANDNNDSAVKHDSRRRIRLRT